MIASVATQCAYGDCDLPRTGFDTGDLLVIAVICIVAGILLIANNHPED